MTPEHIVPEWYFLPFYAILRAITDDLWIIMILPIDGKLGGVLAMFGAIAVMAIVPWLDTSRVHKAAFFPTDGYVDPYLLSMSYIRAAQARGRELDLAETAVSLLEELAKIERPTRA